MKHQQYAANSGRPLPCVCIVIHQIGFGFVYPILQGISWLVNGLPHSFLDELCLCLCSWCHDTGRKKTNVTMALVPLSSGGTEVLNTQTLVPPRSPCPNPPHSFSYDSSTPARSPLCFRWFSSFPVWRWSRQQAERFCSCRRDEIPARNRMTNKMRHVFHYRKRASKTIFLGFVSHFTPLDTS